MALSLVADQKSAQSQYVATVECAFAEVRDCLTAMTLIMGDIAADDKPMVAMSALRTAIDDRLTIMESELCTLTQNLRG